jgi:hypothetical protein
MERDGGYVTVDHVNKEESGKRVDWIRLERNTHWEKVQGRRTM